MPNGRPPADAQSDSRPRARRTVANEDGLRSLGEQMHESTGATRRRGAIADPGPRPADEDEALSPYPDPRAPRRRRGGRGVRGVRRSGRPKMRRWTKALLIVGMVLVLFVGAAAGYLGYLNSLIHRIKVLGLSSNATSGALADTENILLVGSTSRCALKHQYIQYGLCSEGVTGVNSDVVMILHLNPDTKAVSILSIPRDLFIPNARTSGANKIDAALAQSPSQLVAAVEEDFGIPIQHYVELNFESFASVVDALGGINMYFPMPVFDDYSGLTVTSPGCIHLDGVRALQVVRARHLQYKSATTYDLELPLLAARDRRATWPASAATTNSCGCWPPPWPTRGWATRSRTARSSPASPRSSPSTAGSRRPAMVNLVLTFHSVNVGSAPQLTVPVMQSSSLHYYYKGYDYGNIEFPSQPQDQQVDRQGLRCQRRDRHHDGQGAAQARHRDGVGAQRERHRQPGHHHLQCAGGARLLHRRGR